MIQDIIESGFNSGVTLNAATVTLTNMGERTISADIKIAGGASIGDNCFLTFRGEKFVPVVKDPHALKNNERVPHVVSVIFQSEVISELKRYWFFKPAVQGSDIVVDTYTSPIGLNLQNFVTLFNQVLSYYYGESIVMELGQDIDPSEHAEAIFLDIDYTTVWEVLAQVYEKYEVRWKISSDNNVYTITLSNSPDTIQHVFSYGYDGGLTHIERQVQDEEIHNKIFGRGVDTNLPHYYFKRVPAGDTSCYASDPDALYELKDIYFDSLRDITFRWYVRGWMQNENRDTTWETASTPYFYPTYQESDIPVSPDYLHDSCLYAFRAGKTDEKFNPIEYIKDDASIMRYGEIWGKAEPDENIYPTIKVPIVAYENTTPDEVEAASEKESRIEVLNDAIRGVLLYTKKYATTYDLIKSSVAHGDKRVYTGVISPSQNEASNAIFSDDFVVEDGMVCSPTFNVEVQFGYWDQKWDPQEGLVGPILGWVDRQTYWEGQGYTLTYNRESSYYYVKDADTGEYLVDSTTGDKIVSPVTIPSGHWQIEFHIAATEVTPPKDSFDLYPFAGFRIRLYDIRLNIAVEGASPYRLFDIWLGNVWNTEKGQDESDEDYVRRVWAPILGTAQEAAVYFASGELARSSDYDFKVAGPLLRGVSYDTSKTGSHWRLTLIKSEAEYQADGKFIPRQGIEPSVNDLIAFVNDTVVYPQSVIINAEERVNAYKQKILDESKDIQPSWVVKLDKVRISTGGNSSLYSQLDCGRKMTIFSETLIPETGHSRSMYIDTLTITWGNDTIANPDVDVVLSQEIRVYRSPIKALQSSIREIEVTKVDEEQASDTAQRVAMRASIPSTGSSAAKGSAPLQLANTLQSPDFATGLLEGKGWSIYRDTFGNCVIEADKIMARNGISVPSILTEEWKHQGGVQILSAANMRIASITDTTSALRCYFDAQNGSVTNLFAENDIVLCTRTDNTSGETKSYRYLVVGLGENFVELSKTNHIGDTAEVGDELIQFGNTTDVNRQHVIVIDAASGHERMLFGLNSISATGDVYYYAGAIQSNGTERRRWFVGDRDNSKENFIEYAWNETTQSYALIIGGDVYVGGSDVSLDALNYLAAALRDGGQAGGLILSNQIAVYTGTGAQAQVMGGINGAANAENIAAWFGGAMTTEGQSAAKVVFKFDGSGYVAAKHISWDAAGNCTIDGTVKLTGSGATVGSLLELVQSALQKSQVAGVGAHNLPVYFDENGDAHAVDSIRVSGNIESTAGGVAAKGIANLGMGAGGGQGDVTSIQFDSTIPYQTTNPYTAVDGLLRLPVYPSLAGMASQEWVAANFAGIIYESRVEAIEALIPSQATSLNQLADKAFVNSSIATATATYQGSYNLVSDLSLTTSATREQIASALAGSIVGEDNNDYAFVEIPTSDSTPTQIASVERYKFNGTAWAYEYTLNNSGMTAAQWASLNSGITASGVALIYSAIQGVKVNGTLLTPDSNQIVNVGVPTALSQLSDDASHRLVTDTQITAWGAKYDLPSGGIPKTDLAQGVQDSLGLADTALQSHQTIYSLTIKKNGTQVGNVYNPASGAQTIDLTDVASAATLSDYYSELTDSIGVLSNAVGAVTSMAEDNTENILLLSGRADELESYFTNGVANNAARLSNTTKIGDTNQPVYFTANGVPAAISYTIGRNVAANEDVTPYTPATNGNVSVNNHTIGISMTVTPDPTSSGTDISFIASVSQDSYGKISATKKAVRAASASQSGIVDTLAQTFAGDKTFNGNVQSMKGIAAHGIANLAVNASGGAGDVTSIKFGNGSLITSADGLLSVPVGQGTNNGQINIGGQDISVKGLGSFAYISSLAFADLTNKPTTIAGYGITDAVTSVVGLTGAVTATNIGDALTNAGYKLTDTDTKVTSAANHYAPSSVAYTPTAGSWSWDSTTVVTGITKDDKGHIVGITTTKIANPNTDHYAWADITDKPATATRWPSWSEVTSKPETFYTLPIASASVLGGIKVGANLSINSSTGVLSATDTTYTNGTGLSLSGTTFSISQANVSTILNLLSEGASPATRDDYIIAQYAGGGTTTTSYHRRKLSNVFAALNSSDVTTALGYTPFNNASFTQANIKSTLGISNWALASSKPSYAFSEITGSVANSQLANSYIGIGNRQINLGSVLELSVLADDLALGSAASYAATNAVTKNSGALVTSGAVWSAIDALPEPMVFRGSLGTGGTITALPVDGTAKIGDTYKVITAGTYASKAAKVGDTFICLTKTSSANTWELIPSGDEPSGTVTSVAMSVPTGLSVSGSPITTSGTFAITFASGYSIPTTAKQGNWDTAYGWGNHASAGYVKTVKVGTDSYSPTNGVVSLPAYPYAVSELVNDLGYTANTGTVTSVTIKGSGPISVDYETAITGIGTRTISHADSGATAGSYGDSAAQTPAYGGTFKVPYVTVDAKGHVTAISEHTVKIPASDNTWRPLGTGANDACAGNDSRLSDARTPVAHASSATTYGVGTTSNYGHVKLATGDMNGAAGSDGVAVGKNHTHSQYALAANLGTASTHAHGDYVTAIGVSGNTLTWSKGGTAQTAITVPYATTAGGVAWSNVSSRPTKLSQFTDDLGSSPTHTHSQYLLLAGGTMANTNLVTNLNADYVNGYHITDAFNLPYKYVETITCPYSSITENYWYVRIKFKYNYQGIVPSKTYLVASYSDKMSKAELQVFGYYLSFDYKASWYNESTIKGIASVRDGAAQVVWLKMMKPTVYEGNYPDGTLRIYHSFIDTITCETTAPQGVTFTDVWEGDGQHIYDGFIKTRGFVKNGSSSAYVLTGDGGHKAINTLSVNSAINDSDGNAINSTYLKKAGGTMSGQLNLGNGHMLRFLDANNTERIIGHYSSLGDLSWYNGTAWGKVWHQNNDGSGSGLDADKLDGHHYSEINDAIGVLTNSVGQVSSMAQDNASNITLLSGRADDLESYFTNGVAKSAAKLTTVSQTLFGNTYWTSGGVPTSIGTSASPAALNYVTNIDSIAYFDRTNSRLGVGTPSPTEKLHVAGNIFSSENIYASKGVASQGIANLSVAAISGSNYVTQVKIGSTAYNPSDGVVSLPAYPTVPTALSGFTNDVGYITGITSSMVTTALGYTPAQSDTKNTTGADNTTSKIYLVGPTSQTSSNGNARTYSNSECYASGGYLYSKGKIVANRMETPQPQSGSDTITLNGTEIPSYQMFNINSTSYLTKTLNHPSSHSAQNGFSYILISNSTSSEATINMPSGCIAPASSFKIGAGKSVEVSYFYNGNNVAVIMWSTALQAIN